MICLWGWHRRDSGYEFVPEEFADQVFMLVSGVHDLARGLVTVVSPFRRA